MSSHQSSRFLSNHNSRAFLLVAGMSMSYNRFALLSQSVFFAALLSDFSLSNTATAGVFSTASAVYVLGALLVGALLVRWQTLLVIAAGVVVMSLAFVGSGLTARFNMLYITYGAIFGIGRTMVGYVPTTSLLSETFPGHRGRAQGIVFFAAAMITVIATPLIQGLVDSQGWRRAMVVVGIGSVLLIQPVVLYLLFRTNPVNPNIPRMRLARFKRRVTGAVATQYGNYRAFMGAIADWTLRWLVVAHVFVGFSAAIVLVPLIAHLGDRGFSPARGALTLSTMLIFAGFGSLLGPSLSDRLGRELIYTIAGGLMIFGLVWLILVSQESLWMLAAFVTAFGLGWGTSSPLQGAIIADLFPGQRLYMRLGMLEGITGLSYAIGVLVAGVLRDQLGTYSTGFVLSIAGTALVIVSYWFAAPRAGARDLGTNM